MGWLAWYASPLAAQLTSSAHRMLPRRVGVAYPREVSRCLICRSRRAAAPPPTRRGTRGESGGSGESGCACEGGVGLGESGESGGSERMRRGGIGGFGAENRHRARTCLAFHPTGRSIEGPTAHLLDGVTIKEPEAQPEPQPRPPRP